MNESVEVLEDSDDGGNESFDESFEDVGQQCNLNKTFDVVDISDDDMDVVDISDDDIDDSAIVIVV
jgi:hypothetical protein